MKYTAMYVLIINKIFLLLVFGIDCFSKLGIPSNDDTDIYDNYVKLSLQNYLYVYV